MSSPSETLKNLKNTIDQIETKLQLHSMADETGKTGESIRFFGIDDLISDAKIYSKNGKNIIKDLEEKISDLEEKVEEVEEADCDCETDYSFSPLYVRVDNLAATMKMEFIASVFEEFTLEELEKRLSK
jgi:hypothetical protein